MEVWSMRKATMKKTWMKLVAGAMSAALIFGCNMGTPITVRADEPVEAVGESHSQMKKDAAEAHKIEVKVTDKDGKVLKGAKIGLFEESVTEYTEENSKTMKSTDEKGIASFTDVAAGTYQIVQMDKADGYKISDTIYVVVINSEGNVEKVYEKGDADRTEKELTFTNEKVTTTDEPSVIDTEDPSDGDGGDLAEIEPFQFTLVDEDGNPLKGGTFAIFDKDANTAKDDPIATAKSDEDGIVMFTTIKTPGEYVIVQTKAPEGYKASDIVLVATLNEDGTVNPLYEKGDKEQNEVIEVVNTKKEMSSLTPSTNTGRSVTTTATINTSGKKTINAQKLPETGKEQVAVYLAVGSALIVLGAGLWLTKGRRKYEK